MPKLTQQFVDRATAPATGQRFFRDARVQGLALRVTSGGAKAWVWEGRVRGRVRRHNGQYPANRGLALPRAMFNLARTWGLASGDNPATGIRAFHEEKRDRFLVPDELGRALVAIDQEPDWRWRAYFRLALLLG